MKIGKLHRWWILFWYNDITRMLLIVLPGHLIFTLPILVCFGIQGEMLRSFVIWSYIAGLGLATVYNDYETNLNKIGLDLYRKPL